MHVARAPSPSPARSMGPAKLYAYVEPSKDKKLSALRDSIALIRSNARVVSAVGEWMELGAGSMNEMA